MFRKTKMMFVVLLFFVCAIQASNQENIKSKGKIDPCGDRLLKAMESSQRDSAYSDLFSYMNEHQHNDTHDIYSSSLFLNLSLQYAKYRLGIMSKPKQ